MLVSVTERMEGSESGDRSGGTCTRRESCLQKGESSTWETSPGIFIIVLYYSRIVLPSHEGKALGRAGILGLAAGVTAPRIGKGRSLLCCSWVKAL